MSASSSSALSSELSAAELGDARLSHRLRALVESLERAPELSFPRLLSESELEGAYRFFRNGKVTAERLLAPHITATHERARAEGMDVLAVHDSSLFDFGGESDRGLRPLKTKKVGFLAHFTLAVSADGSRRPLGVLAMTPVVRSSTKSSAEKKRARWKRREDSESARWWQHVEQVNASPSQAGPRWIHLMDREADDYALFSRLVEGRHRFVIRLSHDRRLETTAAEPAEKLQSVLATVRTMAERDVPLSRRRTAGTPSERRIHPPRTERMAHLSIGATRVCLQRPREQSKKLAATTTAHVVHVWEPDPPAGNEPITWTLLTTEPIDTAEQLLRVVDFYRARWVIEEYFKALKTGCAYESRQLESPHSLFNALALFVPIAWQLLALRSGARHPASPPATATLSRTTLAVLAHFSRIALPAKPTLREAMLAIAALGGHLKHNGEPGWQTLWAGYTKLLTLEEGWRAARDL